MKKRQRLFWASLNRPAWFQEVAVFYLSTANQICQREAMVNFGLMNPCIQSFICLVAPFVLEGEFPVQTWYQLRLASSCNG